MLCLRTLLLLRRVRLLRLPWLLLLLLSPLFLFSLQLLMLVLPSLFLRLPFLFFLLPFLFLLLLVLFLLLPFLFLLLPLLVFLPPFLLFLVVFLFLLLGRCCGVRGSSCERTPLLLLQPSLHTFEQSVFQIEEQRYTCCGDLLPTAIPPAGSEDHGLPYAPSQACRRAVVAASFLSCCCSPSPQPHRRNSERGCQLPHVLRPVHVKHEPVCS